MKYSFKQIKSVKSEFPDFLSSSSAYQVINRAFIDKPVRTSEHGIGSVPVSFHRIWFVPLAALLKTNKTKGKKNIIQIWA